MASTDVTETRNRIVEQEHEEWLQDTVTWQQEHNRVIELMSKVHTWLEEQADLLDEHEKRIRNHTHRMARDQSVSRTSTTHEPPETTEQVRREQQRRDVQDHERVRQVHEKLKSSHSVVMDHATELLNSLRFQSPRPK